MENKRLVKRFKNYDLSTLVDTLSMLAANIEDALIQGGANVGSDYKILDLYQLAIQYISDEEKLRLSCYREFHFQE